MEKLVRSGSVRRMRLLGVFLAVLCTGAALKMPNKAEAAPLEKWTDYYFDAAKTQYAGSCLQAPPACGGEHYCTGTTPTPYYTIYYTTCLM